MDENTVKELDDEALLREAQKRLAPKQIILLGSNNNNSEDEAMKMTLAKHQFLHLHHMKTGGTSMDGVVNCAMQRLKAAGYQVSYTNIHECSEAYYTKCVSGQSESCVDSVRTAAILSYCAPLKDLSTPFAWINGTDGGHDTDYEHSKNGSLTTTTTTNSAAAAAASSFSAVTVLRHPVARVWSMFRFQTRNCYKCLPLKDVYAEIDAGTSQLTRMCKLQLLNHQTRNLLSTATDNDVPDSVDHVKEAIYNMKNVFTMVGLTEDMPNTAAMAGKVFPWLAETVVWEDAVGNGGSGDANHTVPAPRPALLAVPKQCPMPHANASPKNNRCGPDGKSHWDLPPVPDEETARIIMEHNQMDVQLYEAAVVQFELQKRALGLL